MNESVPPQADDPPPETLRELYDHAPCGYLTARLDGTIIRANQTVLALLRRTEASILGQPVQTILTPAAAQFYETKCRALLDQHGTLAGIAVDAGFADGRPLPVQLTWRPINGPSGQRIGYRITVIDATERAAYEQALQAEHANTRKQEALVRDLTASMEHLIATRTADLVQHQKMESLGQLTGGVAHDFNNLLTPILISLDVLYSRYLTDERALRMAASAISAAERARVLIARLLAFARRQHLRPKPIDLSELIEATLPRLTEMAGAHVTLRVDLPRGLPHVLFDPNQLETALTNLCRNARDAMPEGGSLTITADEITVTAVPEGDVAPGQYVRLSVIDTGPGMTAETLRRAAEPFFSTKSIGKGTGLGLSMVFGLAAQSGGKLVLDSAPNHGTTATIWLPVDQSEQRARTAVQPVTPQAVIAPTDRPISILLVDDDDLVRFATTEMLTDLGHSVVQAASGTEALEAMREHRPFDLLITDYLMPGLTGVELARIARLSQPGLPGLLITAYANALDVDRHGLHRLAKPFGTADLSEAIAHVLSATMASAQ